MLHLDDALAAAMLGAASRAYPAECCGLIEGDDAPDGWQARAVHETANLADDPSRHFLIDPQAQFDLLRALRGSARRIIGCFHSHPGGVAEPSATDRANAFESDFLWLIAGGSPDGGLTLRAFHFREGNGFSPIALRGGE
ncbi:MAG TPA: M67 family metallopeptidase [Micropepsaceae bacterium]|nr:M67 family metallopeptidase [Micropepsaceae bacterium]